MLVEPKTISKVVQSLTDLHLRARRNKLTENRAIKFHVWNDGMSSTVQHISSDALTSSRGPIISYDLLAHHYAHAPLITFVHVSRANVHLLDEGGRERARQKHEEFRHTLYVENVNEHNSDLKVVTISESASFLTAKRSYE